MMGRAFALALVLIVTAFPVRAQDSRTAEFLDSESNVRSGPGTKFKALFMPEKGTRCPVLEASGDWYRLQFPDGQNGWTNKKNIRFVGQEGLSINCTHCRLVVDADLNGDGGRERISLKAYERAADGGGDAVNCCLVVQKNGKVIWQDSQHEFPFMIGDAGVCDLSTVGDLDGDGKAEVVVSSPTSDPSPKEFHVLKWDGRRFVLWRKGYLKAIDATEKNYAFVDGMPEGSKSAYVSYFAEIEGGLVKTGLYGGSMTNGRTGLARFGTNGVVVEQWKESNQ